MKAIVGGVLILALLAAGTAFAYVVDDSDWCWQMRSEVRERALEAREAALNPTGRIGTPQDIAAIVAFLASEEASWINGQNIIVDGGLTALSPQPPYAAASRP